MAKRSGGRQRHKRDGPDKLDKWVGETEEQHRALLLLAMQDPGSNPRAGGHCNGRNLSLVIPAVSPSRTTVRRWVDRYRWADRIEGHGTDAQAYAIELYRGLYMRDFGEKDLPHVGAVVSLPMTTVTESGQESAVQEEAHRIVRKLLPPDPEPEVQGKVQRAVDAQRDRVLARNKVIAGLAESSLKALHASIKAATDKQYAADNPHVQPVKVRVSDLPRLQKVLAQLEEERARLENPELAQLAGGAAVVDSVRVKIAKETGGNVLDAIREDCLEIVAIVDGMRAPDLTAEDLREDEHGRAG